MSMDVPTSVNRMDARKPTARMTLPKEKVKDMTIDKPVTMTVSGTIKSMNACYDDESLYDIELQDVKVEKTETGMEASPEDKKMDETLASMPKEKLKQKLMEMSPKE